MSSDDYSSRRTFTEKSYAAASSPEELDSLLTARGSRIEKMRSEIDSKSSKPRPKTDPRKHYSEEFIRNTFTKPHPGVKRIYLALIDNSGSNRVIANHFRNSTNYLRLNLKLIDPEAQFGFVYFSDHCDGENWWQAIDWISPDEEGEKILISTLFHVEDADGKDAPEAHECVLWDVCKLDFGDATKKHLILISDVVGHDMGMRGDRGCRNQRDWRDSLKKVDETFSAFEMIGCGDDPDVAELQKQFISYLHPELLSKNLLNLSYIKNPEYRLGIVLNAFLFVVARHGGMQTIEGFLARLYEKWISDPIFGQDTDERAKEAIIRFAKFIPGQSDEIVHMMSRILETGEDKINMLLKNDTNLI